MGKTIPKTIRVKAIELYKEMKENFTTSFEENKKTLKNWFKEINAPFSKITINLMAGLITKEKKKELKEV